MSSGAVRLTVWTCTSGLVHRVALRKLKCFWEHPFVYLLHCLWDGFEGKMPEKSLVHSLARIECALCKCQLSQRPPQQLRAIFYLTVLSVT